MYVLIIEDLNALGVLPNLGDVVLLDHVSFPSGYAEDEVVERCASEDVDVVAWYID